MDLRLCLAQLIRATVGIFLCSLFCDLPAGIAQDVASKIRASLAKCELASKDERGLLPAISVGVRTDDGIHCAREAPTKLHQFVADLDAVSAAQTKSERADQQASFARALRMQTLKNALVTYLDAEMRYDLDSPKPHKFMKVDTAVKEFCEDDIGNSRCNEVEYSELRKTVNEYRKRLHSDGLKPLTLKEAQAEVNARLAVLNRAYAPVSKQIHDFREATAVDQRPGIGVQDGVSQTVAENRERVKNQRYRTEVEPVRAGYEKFKDRYLKESNSGVGILFYSKAMRDALPSEQAASQRSISSTAVVRSAILEVKSESLALARKTNTLLTDRDLRGGLVEVVKMNPVAVGQVLSHHPEYVSQVCSITSSISKEDRNRRFVASGVRYFTYGAMIVGGVCVATGFLAPAGVAIEGGAVTALGSLEAVNLGVGLTAAGANVGSTLYRRSELSTEISGNQRALITRNGGDLKQLTAFEKEYDESGEELAKTLAMTVLPLGVGKAAKLVAATEVFQGSQAAKSIAAVSETFSANPITAPSVRALDYLCGMMGVTSCQYFMGSFRALPKQKQTQILSDPEELASFTKSAMAAENVAREVRPKGNYPRTSSETHLEQMKAAHAEKMAVLATENQVWIEKVSATPAGSKSWKEFDSLLSREKFGPRERAEVIARVRALDTGDQPTVLQSNRKLADLKIFLERQYGLEPANAKEIVTHLGKSDLISRPSLADRSQAVLNSSLSKGAHLAKSGVAATKESARASIEFVNTFYKEWQQGQAKNRSEVDLLLEARRASADQKRSEVMNGLATADEKLNSARELKEINPQSISLTREALVELKKRYEERGIQSKMIEGDTPRLEIDIENSRDIPAVRALRRINQNQTIKTLTIEPLDNALKGQSGYWSARNGRMEIGWDDGKLLLVDEIGSTAKHEARHMKFSEKAGQGSENDYDGFFTSRGESLRSSSSAESIYDYSMTLEEHYNFTKSLLDKPPSSIPFYAETGKDLAQNTVKNASAFLKKLESDPRISVYSASGGLQPVGLMLPDGRSFVMRISEERFKTSIAERTERIQNVDIQSREFLSQEFPGLIESPDRVKLVPASEVEQAVRHYQRNAMEGVANEVARDEMIARLQRIKELQTRQISVLGGVVEASKKRNAKRITQKEYESVIHRAARSVVPSVDLSR